MKQSYSSLGVFSSVFSDGGFFREPFLARTTTLLALLTAGLSMIGVSPAVSAETCPNDVRQEQNTDLSDCRAYEMVSPPSKNGADIVGMSTRTRASADGNAVAFLSLTGFGDARGTGVATEYVGTRDSRQSNGWSTHSITPGPLEAPTFLDNLQAMESHYVGGFSSDLQNGIFLTFTPLTATSPNTNAVPKIYLLRDLLTPGPKSPQLVSDCPACSAPLSQNPLAQPGFAGSSADYQHMLFESEQSLTADVPHCEPLTFSPSPNECPLHLYEWSNGTVRLAGILPDGSAAGNSQAGQGASAVTATSANGNHQYAPNVISKDGSKIFFTVRESRAVTDGTLYMRTGNDTPNPSTVQINASERTPPDAPQDAMYWTATPDGSKVFFTSPEQLTNTSGGGLYMYDASKPDSASDNLTLLGSSAVGVIGVSDDGSYVYFVTSISSDADVMVWHDGVVHHVATVAVGDVPRMVGSLGFLGATPKLSRVTPDGRHMMFVSIGGSAMPHTGVGDTCPSDALGRCTEVYVYDATANGEDGELTCASCQQPASAPAQTNASIVFNVGRGGTLFESPLNHPLSDDGRFVFFSTGESLVPQDANGITQDVYEYNSVTHTVHLLSSGAPGSSDSLFMDASRDGHDAFFTTRDRLVGWDIDEHVDLYDARIGGGFPEPVQQLACDANDSCRATQGPAATVIAPASSQFSGVGNVGGGASVGSGHRIVKQCSKGRVRRRVRGKTRCVKRKHVVVTRYAAKARVQRSGGR